MFALSTYLRKETMRKTVRKELIFVSLLISLEDLDRTIGEYEYGSLIVSSSGNGEEYTSMSKQQNENHSK
jgi:hypothetical protein